MPESSSTPSRGFGYWLGIFANFAVVGGIIFLGVEVRQNSLMMRAQTRNEIAQTLIEMLASEREPELAGALRRFFEGAEPMPQDAYYLDPGNVVSRTRTGAITGSMYANLAGQGVALEILDALQDAYLADHVERSRLRWWNSTGGAFP